MSRVKDAMLDCSYYYKKPDMVSSHTKASEHNRVIEPDAILEPVKICEQIDSKTSHAIANQSSLDVMSIKPTAHILEPVNNIASDVLEIDNTTGEIILNANKADLELIKTTKIKAINILKPSDFCMINGTWEAKRDALIKILSSLPISYSWTIKEKELTTKYASITGVLTIHTGSISRTSESMGICELSELKGSGGMHFMNARAETRALKRAIEVLFGSVINYFVMHCLADARDVG